MSLINKAASIKSRTNK